MNAHLPQSYESMVELEEIAAIPHHIVAPRHAKPLIGVFQDSLVGSYRLTQRNVEFSRREFMSLMMWNKRFDGTLPAPRGANGRYTGQQVLSALLPPVNIEMGNKSHTDKSSKADDTFVKIQQGDIAQGVIDGDIWMKPSRGIIHVTYNDHGEKETVDLLDALQNTVEHFLVMNGFSVGISDLVADDQTMAQINQAIQTPKKKVDELIMQLHLDLFDNNTGKTNQQEFEDRIFGILNDATAKAGDIGQTSLSLENRLLAMVRSGSKGEKLNVAQMMACLGQTAIEGKRVPYGLTDRTLPHYKKYDDSAESRGFIESSFIRGLTPQQFFFHAMSGREGLIDTAVKSVTADTEIVVQVNGSTKWTKIGPWIDSLVDGAAAGEVEHYPDQANMELLNLKDAVYIPTCDEKGMVSWGQLTAVTRHDPGECLYRVVTRGGRTVTVAKSQSLIVWDAAKKEFHPKPSMEVKAGDAVPSMVRLCEPVAVQTHIPMRSYVAKLKGPNYTLPEQLPLTERNGLFFGLYLAEGNSDIKSGYVNIANNDPVIRDFAEEWFKELGINTKQRERIMEQPTRNGGTTKGQSDGIRGFSRLLGQFLEKFLGAGSANKFVPDEAFGAPIEFVRGLLNGYFSGDGTVDVKKGSITVNSASKRLIDGISSLCSRFGVFGKMSKVQLKSNNVMTPVERILPTYRFAICAKWATLFAKEIPMISTAKQARLNTIKHAHEHRNFPHVHDVTLDTIESIEEIPVDGHPKLYDVTVPSTLNFAIANGLVCRDTADTGYIQRQLVKSMEDFVVQHDGTVRDTNNNIIQFHYGEDGINPTKIETQSLAIGELSEDEIWNTFGLRDPTLSWAEVLDDSMERVDEETAIQQFVAQILEDRRMLVEDVLEKKSTKAEHIFAPVNLKRWILNVKTRFGLKPTEKTDLTPMRVLQGIQTIIDKTHSYHKIWAALLRFHLAPHKLIVEERFTVAAFEMLVEMIVLAHMKAWVQPGDQVGIVAAQSIGEPSTQMSSLKSTICTVVCGTIGKEAKYYGSVGNFVDALLEENAGDVLQIAADSVVLPLADDYYIVGVSDDEKTSWKRISEVSRHPANGGMVEVVTRTGRRTTATLTHSFLKRSQEGVVPVLGSDLKVGMRIPVAKVIPESPDALMEFTQEDVTYELDRDFGWVCGIYLADGCFTGNAVKITKIHPVVEQRLRAFAAKYDITVTTRNYRGKFGPGKDTNLHSANLKTFLDTHFKTGSHEKELDFLPFFANTEFICGLISGFFDGDGNVFSDGGHQSLRASSRNKKMIDQIAALLGYAGIFGSLCEETSVRMPDEVQYTLQIPRKFAQAYKDRIGFHLTEKAAELDKMIAYNQRNTQYRQEVIDKIPELGRVIAQTGKLLKMPGQSRTYGRWAKKESIGRQTLEKYMVAFEEQYTAVKEDLEPTVQQTVEENMALLRSALQADVFWDEIVELIYHEDPKEFVYDFTVPGNDSFMVDNNILVHNTLNKVLLRTSDCLVG